MESAAKKKNSLAMGVIGTMIVWASALLFSSAGNASSASNVGQKSRAEVSGPLTAKSVEHLDANPINATRYYDVLEGVALECTVAPVSTVRSGTGHGYAANVLEGGTGRAFAGHGELRYGSGDLIVPQGTSITMPRMGHQIQDVTGRLMERGDWDGLTALARTNPKVADDLIGMSSYLPGARIPNLTLKAPDGLTIMRASKTVEDATPLQILIQDAQGNWCWAACTKYRR